MKFKARIEDKAANIANGLGSEINVSGGLSSRVAKSEKELP
jgi:hypothetical protein